ncbi:MAG: glycosyl transferase family 2 [Gemmatimonadetes bacterium]|nr:glycosyl transferase family 2 [Gemmatimonadota bacterium]MBE85323.1 glycosyl transferase family 2 [Gemmatimonadota bacterium]
MSDAFPQTSTPDVSIIIPHYLGDILSDCLASIFSHIGSSTFEVIVADDQPHDDGSITRALEKWPGIQVIPTGGKKGLAYGCNRGLEVAKGRYAILLNNDVEVSDGWLDALVRAADGDSKIGACQPKMRSMRNKEQLDAEGAAGGLMDLYAYPFCLGRVFDTVEMDEGQYDTPQPIFWALGGAMFVRMSAIRDSGLMDEAFYMHMEEIDLSWRLHMVGYRIVSVPGAVLYHWGGFSLKAETFQRLYLKHRNSFIMLLKNWSLPYLIRTIPVRILLECLTGFAILKGDWKRGLAGLAGALWVLCHPIDILKRRKVAQSARTVSDREVVRAMYGRSVVVAYFLRGKRTASEIVGSGEDGR